MAVLHPRSDLKTLKVVSNLNDPIIFLFFPELHFGTQGDHVFDSSLSFPCAIPWFAVGLVPFDSGIDDSSVYSCLVIKHCI